MWPFSNHQHRSTAAVVGGERLDDDEPVDVHSWGDRETHIRVTNPEGFAVKVRRREGKREEEEEERETKKRFSFSHRLVQKKTTSKPFFFPSLSLSLSLSLFRSRPTPA